MAPKDTPGPSYNRLCRPSRFLPPSPSRTGRRNNQRQFFSEPYLLRTAGSRHRSPAPQYQTAGHLDYPVQAAEEQELSQVNIDAPGLPGKVRRYQQLDSVSLENPVPGGVPPADVGIDRYLYSIARSR
jgi:hypothetical protein